MVTVRPSRSAMLPISRACDHGTPGGRLVRQSMLGASVRRASPFILIDGRAFGHLEQFIRTELRRIRNDPVQQLSLLDWMNHKES